MPRQTDRPYRLVAEGSSLVQRCEHLTVALREAEKMAKRLRVNVRVYEDEQLVMTIKPPT